MIRQVFVSDLHQSPAVAHFSSKAMNLISHLQPVLINQQIMTLHILPINMPYTK